MGNHLQPPPVLDSAPWNATEEYTSHAGYPDEIPQLLAPLGFEISLPVVQLLHWPSEHDRMFPFAGVCLVKAGAARAKIIKATTDFDQLYLGEENPV